MSYKSIFEQTAEWESARLGKFTASEIHKLMQKGRGKDKYFGEGALTYIKGRLAEILTQEKVTDLEGRAAIEWGRSNEIEAVVLFEKQLNVKVKYYGGANPCFIPYEPLPDWAGGSPDGETEDAIIEVKAPYNSSHHIKYLLLTTAEQIKEELDDYYAQIQFNMICSKKKKGYFISYDPRVLDTKLQLHAVEIPFDEPFCKELEERVGKAVEKLKEFIASVMPVVVAHRDEEVDATIVQ